MIRGGSSESEPKSLRTTSRHSMHPLSPRGIGLRLVLSAKDASGFMAGVHSKTRKEIAQSIREPFAAQPVSTNLETKNETTLQPIAQKEGGGGGQPVKPPEGRSGVGAKIGLTILVFVLGSIIYTLISEIIGHGLVAALMLAITVYTISKIWSIF